MKPPDYVKQLVTALDAAAESYRDGDALAAYNKVAMGLVRFGDALNAPPAVAKMLANLMGEFANLNEGRPTANLTPRAVKGAARQPLQNIALWTAASVFVDHMPNKKAALAEAERRLTAAGCPLPSNSSHTTAKPGGSLEGWRKQRRSGRSLPDFQKAAARWNTNIEKLIQHGMSKVEAASMLLDAAISQHYSPPK